MLNRGQAESAAVRLQGVGRDNASAALPRTGHAVKYFRRRFRIVLTIPYAVGVTPKRSAERHPEYEKRTNGVLEQAARSEKQGRRFVFHPDGSFENAWGVRFRLGAL